ncbi:glycosyl hydrolase family 18 protein [Halomicrobium katesii]|uniref:glycosyl hydrolase family 18 protein n=1 Tax=Halomicrobium katesii TaxID=437163 RepID=UPI000476EE2B|nr:glycosyl hydrolase family 18 protein [Halomicrobium katesii]
MQRRNYLQSLSALAGLAGVSAVTAQEEYPTYDSSATYNGGDRVVYEGYVWEAQWWTKGTAPSADEAVWEKVGPADGGGGDDGGSDDGGSSDIPAYDSSATYTGGDQVTYDGFVWEAEWWTKGTEPAESANVWTKVRAVDDGDNGGDDGGEDGGSSDLNAVIDASATRVDVGEDVTLDASGSEGDIESYEWMVGDQGPISGVENTVTLDEEGTYEVTLTVTDADGNEATATRSVFVGTAGGTQPGDKRVVAYYRQWAQYDREYTPSDMPLDKITHVQYAFARPEEDGSVNLVGDSHGQQAFWNQNTDWRDAPGGKSIAELAEENEDTKFTLSIGGWGDSEYFSYAAETEENRQRFADQCAEWVDRGNLDGIDIDWEFPHGGGCQGDGGEACNKENVERPEIDIPNFTKLCQAVRDRLDEKAAEEGREEPYEVTAAVNADPEAMADYEHDALSDILDFILVMTFDYAGIWSEYTRHHAPLKENPDNPFEKSDSWNASYALSWFEQQGWSPDQLNMAVPFYGRSWSNVNDPDGEGNGEDDGLFQKFDGEDGNASGEGTFGTIGGIYEYYDLAGGSRGGSSIIDGDDYETYIDEDAMTAYSYNPDKGGGYDKASGEMISHDTVETMEMKAQWLRDSPYGGTMLWAIGGDTKDGELISTLWNTLNE